MWNGLCPGVSVVTLEAGPRWSLLVPHNDDNNDALRGKTGKLYSGP